MKERITEQAIQLFERKGFSETSIQDIVDALGVTKGTFYYYFSNKEALLMDIHIHYIDDMLSYQEQIFLEQTKTNKEKLGEIIYKLIHTIESQGPSARVFFREMRNLNEQHFKEIIGKRDQFRFNLEKLIEEGISAGEFRDTIPADVLALAVLGITNWTYQWFKPSGKYTDRELSDYYMELILGGIVK